MKFVWIVLVSVLLTSCQYSPLFNHKDAPDSVSPKLTLPEQNEPTADCPVKLAKLKACALPVMEKREGGEFHMKTKFWLEGSSPQGPFVDLADKVHVFLWMPDMGHGSSPTQTEKLETGIYQTTRMFFIMPGLWEVHIQMKTEAGVVQDEAVIGFKAE